ncbi:MAG: flagellar hook-length control protein FliK, partial [Sphingobium sp.]
VGGQWIDRMAQEIATLADGSGHSRFQLAPAHLGRIQVDMWQGDDGARVQMLTETDEAARRLRDGQPMLQADARVASLSLNQISIERAPGNLDSARDQAGQQGQRHQFNDPAGQSGGQGQNSAAQHKAPARRDVLNERAAPAPRDAEASVGRRGGRLVRYA